MGFLVYKIVNQVNNKIYFGITTQLLKIRWQQHKCNSNKKNYHLYNAIKKYGFDNFSIEVVKICDSEKEMYDTEVKLISKYKSNNRLFGYNNSRGGESSRFGCKVSDSTKRKISEYQKNRSRKPHSNETKLKMKLSAIGRDMSKAVKASADKNRGKPAKNRVKVVLNKTIVFDSITIASKETGVSISSIHNNIKGLSKSTRIGIWSYKHKI